MRTLWKGAISFGLVNVPVGLYTATEKKTLKFNYLHEKCKTPIKYEKRCPVCNVEVPPEEIVWGYEFQKGQYVILKEEDFERLPDSSVKTIDIVDFVDLEEIDPVYFEKSYFLEPSKGGEKAYALLKRAMVETQKIAVAKVTIRSKESLAVLRVAQNVLMMETIFYPDEIRSAAALNGVQNEPALHENEIKMANSLIANLSSHFEPAKYANRYREDLMKLIETKINGGEVAQTETKENGKIIDLMAALRASIAATEKPEAKAVPEKRRSHIKTG
ncbi:MAG TPA: Ku protein [Firmicutes bacterium]|jgi:DNA end-binding protein Ku|nr:Ku protein [Bacillota bacterium]